jgi:hypothetical protein
MELISTDWFGMSCPDTRSSARDALATMQAFRMAFVSMSALGGRGGRSL